MPRGRLFKCVLAVAALLSVFLGLVASAADVVTVQVEAVSVMAGGQTVTTELIMDGTFAAFQGALLYDTDALKLEKVEATSLLSESMTMFNKDEITGEYISGAFASASAYNAVINGAVIRFTFKARSNASGTYSFSLEQLKIYDEKGVLLTIDAVDTDVITTAPPGQATQEPSPPPTTQEPSPPPPPPTTEEPTPPPTTPASQEPTPPPTTTEEPSPAPETQEEPAAPTTNEPAASPDLDGPEATPDPTSPDPNDPDGNVPDFLLPIVAAVVVVGVLLTAVVSRKKHKEKDAK